SSSPLRCPLPASSYCISWARHAVQGRLAGPVSQGAGTSPRAEGQFGIRPLRSRSRPPGGAGRPVAASREDADDRLDFRCLGGERVGEQQRRDGNRADRGESVLGVVRKGRHDSPPFLASGGPAAEGNGLAGSVPIRENG